MTQSFCSELAQVEKFREFLRAFDLKLPETEEPRVSIIIPVHNQFEYTVRSLAAVRRNTPSDSYEVIVLDDASDIGVFLALQSVPGLRVVRNFKNRGFLHACNRAVSNARGEFIVLLNNDTEVGSNWMEPMFDLFAKRADCGLVGAKLVYPDGTLQEAGGIVWGDGSAWNYGRNDDPARPEFNYVRETDYCSAACIMLPRRLFLHLGGFDPRFAPAYYEDVDLAFQVRAAGRKVFYQPASVIVHHEGKSSGTNITSGVKQHQVVNQTKLNEKWHSVLAREHRPNACDVFRARERSFHRKVILFIDHYVPHFDCDAGSRSIFAYIKFFAEQGFSVKFIGDNFYPHEPYQSVLQQLGVEVLTGPWYAANWEAWLDSNGRYIDYVVLSRAHISKRYIPVLRRSTRAKLLFLGVDLLSRTARNEFLRTGNLAKERESLEWARDEKIIFESVEVVYYPSPVEIACLREAYPTLQARVLPLHIFAKSSRCATVPSKERRGLLFVGGFRHPPNVAAMIWFCAEIMPVLRIRLPGVNLMIVGAFPTPEIEALRREDIEVTGHLPDGRLDELYVCRRVAVVPLLDGGGIKGKVLEALWQGLPVVTTPVGAEGIPEIETAAAIAEPGGFAEAVAALYEDPVRLEELARAGSVIIERHFSESAVAEVFAKDVELSG